MPAKMNVLCLSGIAAIIFLFVGLSDVRAEAGYNITMSTSFAGYTIPDFLGYAIVDTSTEIAAGRMFLNCSDIKVRQNTTDVPYYFENCNTTTTKVYWLMSYPNGTQTSNDITIYWNNTQTSSGRNATIMINKNTGQTGQAPGAATYYGGAVGGWNGKLYAAYGQTQSASPAYKGYAYYINFSDSTKGNESTLVNTPVAEMFGAVANTSLYMFGGDGAALSNEIRRFNFSDEKIYTMSSVTAGTIRSSCAAYLTTPNKIYIFGGYIVSAANTTIQVYWVNNDTIRIYDSAMPTAIQNEGCVCFDNNNTCYVIGGVVGGSHSSKIYSLVDSTHTVADTGWNLNITESGSQCGKWEETGNNLIFCSGGYDSGWVIRGYQWLINASAGTVTTLNQSMLVKRSLYRTATIDKSVYIVGDIGYSSVIERFDMPVAATKSGNYTQSGGASSTIPIPTWVNPSSNNTATAQKYYFMNVTDANTASSGKIEWCNSSCVNYTATCSGKYCYLNMSQTANLTYVISRGYITNGSGENVTYNMYINFSNQQTPPAATLVQPTVSDPANGTNVSTKYLLINVTDLNTLTNCLLNWNNGSAVNYTMSIGGKYCYMNISETLETNVLWKVYASNDSQSQWNVTKTMTTGFWHFPHTCASTCASCLAAIDAADDLGDKVILTGDVSGNDGRNADCIQIKGRSNLTLDCQGYSITGTADNGIGTGVYNVDYGRNFNVTIQNCNVAGYSQNFRLGNSSYFNLVNINSTNYGEVAFSIENIHWSNFTNIGDTHTTSSGAAAFDWYNSSNSTLNGYIPSTGNPLYISVWGKDDVVWFGPVKDIGGNFFTRMVLTNSVKSSSCCGKTDTKIRFLKQPGVNTFYDNNFTQDSYNMWFINVTVASNTNASGDLVPWQQNFNITKTLGTNIVGGPYIGGNFWANYSTTCSDNNGDGICASYFQYTNDSISIFDWLPLALGTRTQNRTWVTSNGTSGAATYVLVNASINTTDTIPDCILTVDGTNQTGSTNQSQSCYKNVTGLSSGWHTFTMWFHNTAEGYYPTSQTLYYDVLGDVTPPSPIYASPTLSNNSYTSNNSWIFVNASAGEDLNACVLNIRPAISNTSWSTMDAYELHYDFGTSAAGTDTEHSYIGRILGSAGQPGWSRGVIPIVTSGMSSNVSQANLTFYIDQAGDPGPTSNFIISIYTNSSFNLNDSYCRANATASTECWNITQQAGTFIGNITIDRDNATYSINITDRLNLDHTDGIMNVWLRAISRENTSYSIDDMNMIVDVWYPWESYPSLYYWNDTFMNASMSLAAGSRSCYYNATSLLDKTAYYFRVYANDTAGNMNVTEDRQITINLSQSSGAAPTPTTSITVTSPTAGSDYQTADSYGNNYITLTYAFNRSDVLWSGYSLDGGTNTSLMSIAQNTSLTMFDGSTISYYDFYDNGTDYWLTYDLGSDEHIVHLDNTGALWGNCTIADVVTAPRGIATNQTTGTPQWFIVVEDGINRVLQYYWNESNTSQINCNLTSYWDNGGAMTGFGDIWGAATNDTGQINNLFVASYSLSKIIHLYNSSGVHSGMLNDYNISMKPLGCDNVYAIDYYNNSGVGELWAYCDGSNKSIFVMNLTGTLLRIYNAGYITNGQYARGMQPVNASWMRMSTDASTVALVYQQISGSNIVYAPAGSHTINVWFEDYLGNYGSSGSISFSTSTGGGGGGGGAPPTVPEQPPEQPAAPSGTTSNIGAVIKDINDIVYPAVKTLMPSEEFDAMLLTPIAGGLNALNILIISAALVYTFWRLSIRGKSPIGFGDGIVLFLLLFTAGLLFIGTLSPSVVQSMFSGTLPAASVASNQTAYMTYVPSAPKGTIV